MKLEVTNDGPNRMPEATLVEQEYFERVIEQTFFWDLVEDE